MDILGAHLDAHESPRKRASERADREKDQDWWQIKGTSEAERLLAFEAWCRREIQKRLQLPTDPVNRARRTGQCLVEIKGMLLDLFKRGWLLDGKRLAPHVIAVLDDVGAAQAAGRVQQFWPFFKSVVRTYVGRNAEEMQNEAMRAGNIAHMALADAMKTLPALVAQEREEINATLREQKTRAREKQKQDANQARLF